VLISVFQLYFPRTINYECCQRNTVKPRWETPL